MEQQTNTSFTLSVHRLQIFSATALKLLAAALMLLDHVHQMFAAVGAPMWLTMLGRPVFPPVSYTHLSGIAFCLIACVHARFSLRKNVRFSL